MNWLDVVIILGLIFGGVKGLASGLVKQALQIGSIVLAIAVAFKVSPQLAELFSAKYGWKVSIGYPILFSGITIVISAIGFLCVPLLSRVMSKCPVAERINRGGGFLFGVVWSALIWVILLIAMYQVPWQGLHQGINNSAIACWLLEIAPGIHSVSGLLFTP